MTDKCLQLLSRDRLCNMECLLGQAVWRGSSAHCVFSQAYSIQRESAAVSSHMMHAAGWKHNSVCWDDTEPLQLFTGQVCQPSHIRIQIQWTRDCQCCGACSDEARPLTPSLLMRENDTARHIPVSTHERKTCVSHLAGAATWTGTSTSAVGCPQTVAHSLEQTGCHLQEEDLEQKS